MQTTEDYILELTTIFFIRKKMILTITVLISFAAILIAFFMPPIYAAVSHILVKGKRIEKSPESLDASPVKAFELTKEDLNSEIEILTSHDVIRNTISHLQAKELLFHTEELSGKDLLRLVKEIQGNLTSEIVPNSNVIKVTLLNKAPKQALLVLDHLLKQYMKYRALIYHPSQTAPFFKYQVEEYKNRLAQLEKQLNGLAIDSETADPLKEIENNLLIKQELSRQLNVARSQLIEKKQYVSNLKHAIKSNPIQFFSFIDNLSINAFADKLQGLVIEKGEILRKFHPESQKVHRVEEQIDNAYAVLKSEVQSFLDDQENQERILREKIASLDLRTDDIDTRNIELHALAVSYNRIKQDLDLMQTSYNTLMKRWEEARIVNTSDENTLSLISITSQPYSSGTPVFPNKRTLIPLGVLVGLITGISLGFLSEYFDHTIKRPEDIDRFIGLPTLFSIPRKR